MTIFSTKTKALKTTANLTTAHLSPMELIANAVRHLPHCSCTYPSSWDSEKAAAVIEELKVPGNAEMFNSLALCVIQGLYCELVPDVTVQDKMWAGMLGKNIKDHQSNSKGFKKWWSSQLKFKIINNLQFAIQLIRYPFLCTSNFSLSEIFCLRDFLVLARFLPTWWSVG